MAIGYYHCEERQDRSARQYEYNTRTGEFAGKGKEDLVCSGNSNMPYWAKDNPALFWQANDQFERGTKGKSIIIALPNEMDSDELKHLMEKTVDKLYPNHAVSWSIHDSTGPSGRRNKHAHVQVCERLIDPSRPVPPPEQYFKKTRTRKDGTVSGGYKKDPQMNGAKRQRWLELSKKKWVEICNEEIRQMRDTLFHPRPNEIAIKKSKKKSVHYPRRTWMAAFRNPTRTDNFIAANFDNKIKPIIAKRDKEIKEIQDSFIFEPSAIDYVTSYIWHPFSRKNREKELWKCRLASTPKDNRESYFEFAHDINKDFVQGVKKVKNDMSNEIGNYAEKMGINVDIKSIMQQSRYQQRITVITNTFNARQRVLDKQEAEERERNRKRYERQCEIDREREAQRKEQEAAERKRQQEERERLERERLAREAAQREREKYRKEHPVEIVIHRSKGRGRSR